MKRAFDATVSALALILLAPILLAIGLAVAFDSRGPMLYRQVRVGRGGDPFTLLKFRSMVVDADKVAANVSPEHDPRVTRVGRFLRHWYVDELPQLVNVLRGDMSLVGPRPETPEFVARYRPEERRILEVRPGLCGPSTLEWMDEAEVLAASGDAEAYYVDVLLHERAALDLEYLDRRSFGYDLVTLFRQAGAILGQGSSPRGKHAGKSTES